MREFRSPDLIYLDHNATTPLAPEAREAMLPFLDGRTGNPSSLHRAGQAARGAMEEAREQVGVLAGAPGESVIFVSSGTEADNLALRGVMHASKRLGAGTHLLVSAVEHPAVLRTAQALGEDGFQVEVVPVDACGRVDPAEVERRLRPDTRLVSVMLANNEVGTVQPVQAIARAVRSRGALLHVDAVQGAPYLPVDLDHLGADLVSLSAHKMRGPQGIGALVVRAGVDLLAQITGGAQETHRRAGTCSAALCAGFGVAARRLRERRSPSFVRALRDRLEEGICAALPGVAPLARAAERLPNTTCLSFEGVQGETLVVALDLEGVAASWGAACASGVTRPSHVLRAMGVPPGQARGAVRFSLGETTTEEEIERAIVTAKRVVSRLRGLCLEQPAGAP